jgi:CubicO group peptidase (beta-lactamase class C family)
MLKKTLMTSTMLFGVALLLQATEPTFQKGIGWVSLRDLTSESFSEKFTLYKNDGYRMIDLDGYETPSGVRYSMVWEKNTDNRGWAEYRDMTDDGYHTKWEQLKNDGYRPVDIESYRVSGQQRFGGIWIKNTEGFGWSSKRGLTKAEYESYISEQKNLGQRMIDMEMYETSSGIRYAAVWVKDNSTNDWKEVHGLENDDYQDRLNTLTDQGYLLTNFDCYKDGNTQRYAFICEKRSGFAYQVRSGRTEVEYANLWREYRDKGYRLIDFECYATSSGMRYAGLWIENDKRYDYDKKTSLDNLIAKYLADNNLPGVSVAVIKDGEMIYRRGFGFADKEGNKVAHGETIYLSGSVSKAFGGTLAVKLQDEGKLRNGTAVSFNLNNTTRSYLTNVRKSDGTFVTLPSKHTHTPAQLSAHLACIHHYSTGPEPSLIQYNKAIDALTQIWNADLLPSCTIGTNRNYSTHAFTYLAAVLEKVTNRTSAQLLRSELAEPYGLETLRSQFSSSTIPYNYDRAKPYNDNNTGTTYGNNSWKVFGGGIEISAVDLAWFGWKLLDGKIVKAAARDNILWKKVISNQPTAIAWEIGSDNGRSIADKGGSWNGARANLRIYRNNGLIIAVMSNRTNHTVDDVSGLTSNIANIVL